MAVATVCPRACEHTWCTGRCMHMRAPLKRHHSGMLNVTHEWFRIPTPKRNNASAERIARLLCQAQVHDNFGKISAALGKTQMISNHQTRLLMLSLQGPARPTSTHLLSACLTWQNARSLTTSGHDEAQATMHALQQSSSPDLSVASTMLQDATDSTDASFTQPLTFIDLHAKTGASAWTPPSEAPLLVSPTANPAPFCDLPEWEGSSGVWAASSAEQLAMFFSPTQLGVQFWEGVHTASALPWWASIPLATIGLRALLLPLTLKARAASTHAELLHHAVQQVG